MWIPLVAEVRRLADDGSTIATLPTAPYGLERGMLCVAYDPRSDLLVLASQDPDQPLVAVNATTGALCWKAVDEPGLVFGLVVLPAAGVVIVGSHGVGPGTVHVHRLADGTTLARSRVERLTYMAADASSGTIYASTHTSSIEVLRWDGHQLERLEPLRLRPHLPAGTSHNPLCVMPDAKSDSGAPQLIVGVQDAADIVTFSLDARGTPGALISKQRLASGIEVGGIAADPSGCALVVMDMPSRCARVLPWPLTREFLRRF